MNYFSHCCNESNLRKGGFVLAHGISTSWRRQHLIKSKVVGHIASAARKQRETSAHFLSLIQFGPQAMECYHPPIRVGFPTSAQSQLAHKH